MGKYKGKIHMHSNEILDIVSLANKKTYTDEEKTFIMDSLNEERLSIRKRQEIDEIRINKKQIYKFEGKTFYKFTNMKRDFFILITDCKKFSSRPSIFTLYYRSLDALQKQDMLIKTEIYSDKIFISYDVIRVYFKGYTLEDAR